MLHSIDKAGRITSVNSHWLNVLGYKFEEAIGRKSTDFLTENSRQYAADVVLPKFFATGEVKDAPYQFVTKDGRVLDILLSAYSERGANGEVIGSRAALIDVTERKRAEGALHESEERLRQAVHLAGLGYYVWDAIQDRCVYCSEECARIHGTTVDDFISRSSSLAGAFAFTFPEDRERVRAEFKALRAGRDFEVEYRVITPGGEVRHVREIAKPIFDGDGKVIREHGTIQDITEMKLAEAAIREKDEHLRELQSHLMQTSRVSAMGQMSLGLAHELNQPLAAMVNYVGAAKRIIQAEGQIPPRADELIDKASEQAIQAGHIIRSLRRLFERGGMDPSSQDINEALREVVALSLADAKKEKIITVFELSDDLPPALIDRVQIQLVLFNLLRNSLEAMSSAKKRVLSVSTSQKDNAIEVSISDTGPGLPQEVQDRLFEPFVTTKSDGMGVGLSICHEIIEAHGGTLRATSNPEAGTVFTFTVPVVPACEMQRGDVA
jgi:PAS domain S-box-containing protein